MEEKIFILNDNNTLQELKENVFDDEKHFQSLLENYPELISGSQIDPVNPRRWLLISREYGVPEEEYGNSKWYLDHLFIDQDSIPTLVEVKRSTDTRLRREVVGQMLDYAANAVVYWSIDEIKNVFEKNCEHSDLDPDMVIQEILEDDEDAVEFWDRLELNLKAGKIRMLFVADRIPRELQRIIEYLNEQMNPAEVLGLELKLFGNQKTKTLVPRVVGQTSSAQIRKGSKENIQWTEERFLNELKRRKGENSCRIVKDIMVRINKKFKRIWFGSGKRSGSMIPCLDINNYTYSPFVFWTYGRIEVSFQWDKEKPPFNDINKRKEMLNRLNSIEGVEISESSINMRPAFDIMCLEADEKFNKFIEIYFWYFEEVEQYYLKMK